MNDERVGEPSLRAERSNPASTTVDLGRFAALAMTVMVMENGERTMAVQPAVREDDAVADIGDFDQSEIGGHRDFG